MSAWRCVQDTLYPVPVAGEPAVAIVHVRTFVAGRGTGAVVIGELSDQVVSLHRILPSLWRHLEDQLAADPEVFAVYSFCPAAADPLRRHCSPADIAGGHVHVQPSTRPSGDPSAVGMWIVDRGPAIDVWNAASYTSARLARGRSAQPVAPET